MQHVFIKRQDENNKWFTQLILYFLECVLEITASQMNDFIVDFTALKHQATCYQTSLLCQHLNAKIRVTKPPYCVNT